MAAVLSCKGSAFWEPLAEQHQALWPLQFPKNASPASLANPGVSQAQGQHQDLGRCHWADLADLSFLEWEGAPGLPHRTAQELCLVLPRFVSAALEDLPFYGKFLVTQDP